jgi:hypothetical protein
MAVNKSLPQQLVPATWVDIGEEDITTTFTFQNVAGEDIWVFAGTSLPTGGPRGILYKSGFGETGKTLAELFPGLSSPTRLYAFAPVGGTYTLSAD